MSAAHATLFLLIALLPRAAFGGVIGWDGSDSFAGQTLSSCNWQVNAYHASANQHDGLFLTTDAQPDYSSASVQTQYVLIGDFDFSVDYVIQGGFDNRPAASGARVELSVDISSDATHLVSFKRREDSGSSGYSDYVSLPGQPSRGSTFRSSTSTNGTLRMSRAGSAVLLEYKEPGTDWVRLDNIAGFSDPVYVSLGAAHFSTANQVKAEFLNFKLAEATTSSRPFVRPTAFRSRADFHTGGVVSDYLAAQYWGQAWHSVNPLDILMANGFDTVRVGMLTTTSTLLANTPVAQWPSLGWHNEFWGSREFAKEILRQATIRGLRRDVFFFLSDRAAYAGRQYAPAEWAGLSVDATSAALEAYTFGAATDLMQSGLRPDLYDVGNEIDYGILDFTATSGSRIAIPNGVDVNADFDWMRANVWKTEATLLQAAIRGIRRADPAAKVVLHITTHPSGGAPNAFERAFFSSMIALGVDYDDAGLSLPYASSNWTLNQFTTECWFQRLQDLFDSLQAMGKAVIISESGQLNASPTDMNPPPMADFPFTYGGQAAWMREHLRFLSGHRNVIGFDYFYPEYFPSCCPSTPDLEISGLFASEGHPAPAMAEVQVNLVHVRAVASALGLNATFSSSIASPILVKSISWDFGDGTSATGANVTHRYATAGTYGWRVTLTTGAGNVDNSGTISVTQPRRRAAAH